MSLIPKILKIEITNRCNSKCISCTHRFLKSYFEDMDFELLKGLIDEVVKWKKKPEVHLTGFGEPTLYPHLVKAVEYCSKMGLHSCFYTNGILLTPSLVRDLVDAGLKWFFITLNARNEIDYKRFYNVSKFNDVDFNIKEAWKICRNSKTKMKGGSMILSENEADVSNIVKYWKPYFHSYKIFREIPLVQGRKGRHINYCNTRPWTQIMVRCNGDVIMCCTSMMDIVNNYTIGNVKDNSMLEIFNSSEFDKIRNIIKSGKNLPEFCNICLSKHTHT